MSDIHVLVSPEAGRGCAAGTATEVLDRLRSLGGHVIDLSGADAATSATNARDAVAAGAERLVVLGGDGMVHLAVQAVAGTDAILGVVPLGTGNDFVRALPGIPEGPLEAASVALGDPDPIDAIRVGDRWVASVATAGFSADVNDRANRLRRPKGQSRYTVATVLELPGLKRRPTTITVDGTEHAHDAVMIAVANTAWFGGGMHICPNADPDDGLLDVTVVDGVGRIELLRFFNRVFKGTHLDHPKVHTHRGHRIEITAEAAVWGDGEPITTGNTVLEAVPAAIRIVR
ncbi:MAG: sphingosine kinase [Acidimicrobiaceae bacterium]|nr:sphingosine kinase [Acidimicrobiaceae bacterium]HAB57493.1 sphingosine kinase [Acidimicrobiaceae bacterium]